MASRRKIENEVEARRCLLAAKRRGLSAGEWARGHGIDGRSLNAWRVNIERRGDTRGSRKRKLAGKAPVAKRALVEIVPAPRALNVAGGGRYVLEVAGARVEFGDDVSVVTLRRVLEAVRSC